MVTLHTNLPKFYNDICECIRLFDPAQAIALNGETGDVHIAHRFEQKGGSWINKAEVYADGNTYSYESVSPVYEGKLTAKKQLKRAVKCCVFRALKQCYRTETPWGSLTGIRPSKLARELTKELGEDGARKVFLNTFDVSLQKTELAFEIARNQRPVIESVTQKSAGLYVGIPFCTTRCLYCSFSSGELKKNKSFVAPYIEALKNEIAGIRVLAEENGLQIRSVYVGGGNADRVICRRIKNRAWFACVGGRDRC